MQLKLEIFEIKKSAHNKEGRRSMFCQTISKKQNKLEGIIPIHTCDNLYSYVDRRFLCKNINAKTLTEPNTCDVALYFMAIWILTMGLQKNDIKI